MNRCACGLDEAIQTAQSKTAEGIPLEIELLYLDLDICEPCRSTEESLTGALEEASRVLRASGFTPQLKKIHVTTLELAIQHRFVSSPTIRINGRDIQLEARESHCSSCSSLTEGESVDCRTWLYEGKEYPAPPRALIVDAILQHIHTPALQTAPVQEADTPFELPDNLRRFFASKKGSAEPESCCTGSCAC